MQRHCKKHTSQRGGRSVLAVLGLLLVLLVTASPRAAAQPVEPGVDPDRPWAAEADVELREGRFENAETMYLALAQDHGGDFGLWLRLCFARLQLGRPEEALEAAQRAYELEPNEYDTLLLLAQAQAFSGQAEPAIDTLELGLQKFPQDQQLLETMVSISLGLERWADAAGLLRELIRQHPARASYRVDLGRILLTAGEFDESLENFEEARRLGAPAPLCDAMEGKVHLARGELDRADELFRASLAVTPNGDAYGGLGTIEYLKGERGKAIRSFRRALEYSPDDADLHFNLGNVLAQTDRLQEAEESYRNSLRLDPTSGSTHLNLGLLLLNRFAVTQARQHLRWAAQLDPGLPDPYLHLGRISGALYEYGDAIDAYRAYRERTGNEKERTRIDTVIADLRRLQTESQAAVERGEVHLLQALLPSEEAARSLVGRAREGADFFALAQQESELAEMAGVDIGFVDPAGLSPTLRDAVKTLAPGEMSTPLRTERGWFVFRRVE